MYEKEQRKFSISKLDDIITKSCNVNIPQEWIVWNRDTGISFVHLTTNSGVISVLNSFTIDNLLQVKCYHHGTLVNLSINYISDMRQICTLIDELSNYSEYDTVDIGKILDMYYIYYTLIQLFNFTFNLELTRSISSKKQAITLLEEVLSQSGNIHKFILNSFS